MSDFKRGVMFAAGLFLFGHVMCEIGKLKEQQKQKENESKQNN